MQVAARALGRFRHLNVLAFITLLWFGADLGWHSASATTTYLPSIKIGTAALISPSDADSAYGNNTNSSDQLSAYTLVPTPTPPEIVELARALKYDPDLIYQYVHNNIQTLWMYGLQKGALGTEIDKAGTAFDQAELMVALLRQGTTPFAVNYIAGTITLDETTPYKFSAWTGITNARAACQLLANGGIPAAINGGTSSVLCSSIDANATVSTVQLAHIWVQVNIGGTNYVFDPAYKPYTWKAGIPLATAMNLVAGDPLRFATTGGGYTSGTTGTPAVSYVRSLNAGSLNSNLQTYASNLLAYIQNNNLQGAQIEDIVSGGVIQPTYTTLRQMSLPYAASATQRTWTPGSSSARYNAIPDQYRAKLTIDARTQQYDNQGHIVPNVMMFKDGSSNPPYLYADEIYGRRLTVETDFTVQGIGTDAETDWVNYYPQHACLALDAQPWSSWGSTGPGWCLLSYSYEVLNPLHAIPARDFPTHIILTVDHPYVASSDPSSTSPSKDYMDASLDKNVMLITPLTIVNGWGETSPVLFSKWSDERGSDMSLPVLLKPPLCKAGEGETCPSPYQQPTGGFAREKMAASWLAQFSRAAHLNAAIANSVPQIHHALGFVYGDAELQGVTAQGCPPPPDPCHPDYTIGDNFDRVDVDAGISFSSKTANATARRAAIQAFAASSATLEGAMSGQLADAPDTASTASRFEWGNSPDPDHSAFGQNPYGILAQNFYQYDSSNYQQAKTLTKFDGGVAGSCSLSNTLGWTDAPDFTHTQCYGSDDGITGIAGHFNVHVMDYAQAGFSVVASQEAYLGPGQRGGMILPTVSPGHPPSSYDFVASRQRGGAFVALKRDSSGDPLEIAHVVIGEGTLLTKGGGAGAQPDDKTKYDPATAADILKSRFVDRSNMFGVNLANGSLSYTSPVSLKIGNGNFPYELSAGISWHPAPPPPNFSPVSPIAPSPGWVNSWQNSLALSGSGLEAMGQSDIRAAAGAIVAFYAAQDTYSQDQTNYVRPDREVTSVLIQSWWAHQLSGNVATVNIGGDARQFLKLPTTTQWILPGAGYATMTQNGDRVPYEEKCFHIFNDDPPYALSRGWKSLGVSFAVTNAQGDVQSFSYFTNPYHTDDSRICGNLKGFRLSSWTFPFGASVTPTYTPVTVDLDAFDYLTDVHNPFGRTLTFATGSNIIGNNLNIPDARTISYTQPVGGSSTIVNQLSKATTYHYVGPFTASATQRPVPYVLINTIFTPNDATHANAEYDYDTLGRVNQVKDANALRFGGRLPYVFYLADGTRGERIDPLSQSYIVGYDSYGHPSRYLDELAHKTDAVVDSRGRPMQYVYPEGDCEIFGYDNQNNTISHKRVDRVSNCEPNAGSTHVLSASAVYDQTWNKPTSVTNARGFTTTLDYFGIPGGACPTGNGTSLLCKATRPTITEGTPIYNFAYDSKGKLTDVTGPTGIVTHSVYDANENRTSTVLDYGTGHLNLTTAFGYDPQGDVSSTTDPRGNVTTSLYELDRLKQEDDHHDGNSMATLNAASRTIYDDLRRDIEDDAGLTFSGGTVLTWQMMKQTAYTPTSKVSKVTDADNQVTNYNYYDDDRVQTVTDPMGRNTHFVYCFPADANCASKAVKTEYRAWVSGTGCSKSGTFQECYRRVTYGANGEEATIKDANSHTTTYAYDDFVRLTKTAFPDSVNDYELLTLDENGNVTARRNRAGETLSYTYNALDWITQKCIPTAGASCPASPAVTDFWAYLLDGRVDTLCESSNCSGGNVIDYGYDGAGRQTSVATTIPTLSGSKTVSYQLDANGNRTKLTWPDGYYIGYCYDTLNRMTVAMENSTDANCNTSKLATYSYNPLSRRINLAYGSGAATAYSYSNAGDLLTLAHTIAGTSNNPLYTFTHWANHQLNTETISDSTYRWSPAVTGTDLYTAANSLNQYPSIKPQGAPGLRALGYDGKGNLTTGNLNGDGSWAFTYDPENRMLTACKPNCTSPTIGATYAYDPLGRRVEKSGTGVTQTYFLSDGADEIAEYNSGGTMTTRYVTGPAIDEPIAMVTVSSGAKEYFHTNHQGSIIAMTDSSGAKVEGPYVYDPYGNCFSGGSACSSSGEPYRFTGRRLDPETGLYYYRARYYWPIGGRFMQVDPVGYDADINLYAYLNNDALNGRDPSGAAAEVCTEDPVTQQITCSGDVETVTVVASRPPPVSPPITLTPVTISFPALPSSFIITPAAAAEPRPAPPRPRLSDEPPPISDNERDREAEKDYEICRQLSDPGARARCWASAAERDGARAAGRPLPPLVTWRARLSGQSTRNALVIAGTIVVAGAIVVLIIVQPEVGVPVAAAAAP